MTCGSQEAPSRSEEKAGRSDIHPEPAHVAWSPGTAQGLRLGPSLGRGDTAQLFTCLGLRAALLAVRR